MALEVNPAVVRALLSRVPLLLKTVVLHALSLSPVKGKQNLRTELIVSLLRSFLDHSMPIAKLQKISMKDLGVKGAMWISKVTFPRPAEAEVLGALLKAIDYHKNGDETYKVPELADVEAEWTGFRGGVDANAPSPDVSEEENYQHLMAEVGEDITILYFHGGAYYLMDPCTHRSVTAHLAKLTHGRCLSVRYRLAPQFPFPAAILDALVSYLSLLSPPEGSLHAAVPANKIVFAGDSAGGNASLVLLQVLHTLRRISPAATIRFHGRDVPISLPAGVATNSPWCDLTRSMPSIRANAKFDYFRPPIQTPGSLYTPVPFPPDSCWPTSPPRLDLYTNANALAHILISPLSGPKSLWKDAPPIFITLGEETLEDEGLYFARKAHRAGANVVLERFEGMPHCFAMFIPTTPVAKRSFQGWASFCLDAVRGRVDKTGNALFIDHTATKSETRSLNEIGLLSEEEVQRKLTEGKDWQVEGEKVLLKRWEQGVTRAKL